MTAMTNAKTPAQLADVAAEAVRALNHETQTQQADWEYPGDAYSVVGSLQMLVQRLPQLYGQIADHIRQLAEGEHIRHDRGGDVAAEVAAALDALGRAADDAVAMTAALDSAHSALGPLAYKD
jgi:hypothetical protein